MRRLALLAPFVLSATGCVGAGLVKMPHVDEGGRYAARVGDPATDRCAAQKDERAKEECRKERDKALAFVRKLSVDDQVCLEGNPMGDRITSRCKVRAFISDAGSGKLKLEIRETYEGSRFKPMQNLWYTERALADAWLESAGYLLE